MSHLKKLSRISKLENKIGIQFFQYFFKEQENIVSTVVYNSYNYMGKSVGKRRICLFLKSTCILSLHIVNLQ